MASRVSTPFASLPLELHNRLNTEETHGFFTSHQGPGPGSQYTWTQSPVCLISVNNVYRAKHRSGLQLFSTLERQCQSCEQWVNVSLSVASRTPLNWIVPTPLLQKSDNLTDNVAVSLAWKFLLYWCKLWCSKAFGNPGQLPRPHLPGWAKILAILVTLLQS